LEDRGFIERTGDPDDARASRVGATAAGQDVADRIARSRRDFLHELFADWTPDDRKKFAAMLERFVDSVVTTIHHRTKRETG
jgi:DNA-binding MarR family transcriptional regulator